MCLQKVLEQGRDVKLLILGHTNQEDTIIVILLHHREVIRSSKAPHSDHTHWPQFSALHFFVVKTYVRLKIVASGCNQWVGLWMTGSPHKISNSTSLPCFKYLLQADHNQSSSLHRISFFHKICLFVISALFCQ